MGVAIEQYTTFDESQGDAYLTGPMEFVNDAQRQTYTLSRFLNAYPVEDSLQGGEAIKDRIYFDIIKTWRRTGADPQLNYTSTQPGTDWTARWKYAVVDYTVNEKELGLNYGQLSTDAKIHKFKDVLRQKRMNMITDACESQDDEMWALPASAVEDMEGTNGETPYSIPWFINELPNSILTTSQINTAQTTKMGISSVDNAKWRPVQGTYDGSAASSGATDFFSTMSRVVRQCQFDRLPKEPQFSDPTTKPHVIFASNAGISMAEQLIRLQNDELKGGYGPQDPDYDKPMFRGIPFEYIAALDTAAIFPTGTSDALSDEADGNGTSGSSTYFTGPRFFGLNGKYARMVYHSDHVWDLIPMFSPSDKPFSAVRVAQIWNNFVMRSLRRHFIVSPNTQDVSEYFDL